MKQRLPALVAVLSPLWLLSPHAGAAVVVNNLVITGTTISFGISGTLPAGAPAQYRETLYVVNPDPSADPGFALGNFKNASSSSFTGSQPLATSTRMLTGGAGFGDYLIINFKNELAAGESISGTFTGTWSSTTFDPSQVSSLNLFWGSDDLSSINTGALLGAVAVPEVSSVSLLIAGAAVVLPIRRRRKF